VILVATIYAPVRHHGYLDFDDMRELVWNPDMEPASFGSALVIAFTRPQFSGWVPLATLSHQLDRFLWGREAAGALLTNVALHALAAVLLLLACVRLTGRLGPSAFVAAVFAVHPLHVESVAWAIERKDVLSGVFFAALLWLYARYTERPTSTLRLRAVLSCLVLGLLSKATFVTAPFVLLLLDYWPLRRLDAEALREKLPMFGMVALVSVMTWHFQRTMGAFTFAETLPLTARVENALDAIVAYLSTIFWPVGLAAHYPHPGSSLSVAHVAGCAVLLSAISVGVWMLRRRHPAPLVGWLWFGGMLVPMLGIVQVGMQARADRYMYLPLIGLSIALAFGIDALARRPRSRYCAAALGAVATLLLTAAAIPQVHTWSDSRSLYRRMQSVHPDAAFPELRLGMVEAIEGRFRQARKHLHRAHALEPALGRDAVQQLTSLARAHAMSGRRSEAMRTAHWAIGYADRIGESEHADELRADLEAWERLPGGP
jgi:hypothetical protein